VTAVFFLGQDAVAGVLDHDPQAWPLFAACRGAREEFVPDSHGTRNLAAQMTVIAKAYCRGCPVINRCAAEADRTAAVGLWAGVYRYQGCAGRWRRLLPEAPAPRGGKEALG
jgi:Transcription factor WhiB